MAEVERVLWRYLGLFGEVSCGRLHRVGAWSAEVEEELRVPDLLVCSGQNLGCHEVSEVMTQVSSSSCWAVRSAYFTAFHRHSKNSRGTRQSTAGLIPHTRNPPIRGLSRRFRREV